MRLQARETKASWSSMGRSQRTASHRNHAAGTGTDAFTWTLNIPKDGTYTAYVKVPRITRRSTSSVGRKALARA